MSLRIGETKRKETRNATVVKIRCFAPPKLHLENFIIFRVLFKTQTTIYDEDFLRK